MAQGGEIIHYMSNDGSGWQRLTVAEKAGGPGVMTDYDDSSLAVAADGTPHIAYPDGPRIVRHATLDNGAFVSEIAADETAGTSHLTAPRIVLDSNDAPVVVYESYDQPAGAPSGTSLRVARNLGPGWTVETAKTYPEAAINVLTSSPVPDAAGSVDILVMKREPGGGFDGTWTLNHLRDSGPEWTSQVVEISEDMGLDLGKHVDSAVDAAGNTHMVYVEGLRAFDFGRVMYATNASGSWVTTPIPTVDSGDIRRLRIAISPSGAVGVLATSGVKHQYTTNASGTWTTETVACCGTDAVWTNPDQQSVSYWLYDVSNAKPALAFDGSGKAHAAYFLGGKVEYARRDGSWTRELVADTGDTFGTASTLSPALDITSATPRIAYFDRNRDLVLATRGASGGWTEEFVIRAVDLQLGHDWLDPQIAFDPDGRVHFAAMAWDFVTPKGLYHFRQDGASWIYEVVDDNSQFSLIGTPQVFGPVSFAFDAAGRPILAYFDRALQLLRTARSKAWGWRVGLVDLDEGAGFSNSVAMHPDGHARVAYWKSVDRYVYSATVEDGPAAAFIPGGVWDYSYVPIGTPVDKLIELRNVGEHDLELHDVAGPSGDFSLRSVANDCRSVAAPLSPGESCSLLVRFTPRETFSQSSIVVETNDPLLPIDEVALTGTGYDESAGGGGGGGSAVPLSSLAALLAALLWRRRIRPGHASDA
jgi:hypothetical protein